MADGVLLTLYLVAWAAVWWAIHKWRYSRYQKRGVEDPNRHPPGFDDSFGLSFVVMIVVGIAISGLWR